MNFESDYFEGQTFQGGTGPKQNLTNREFSNCVFKKCDLTFSDLTGSSFSDCFFVDCDLTRAKVLGCSFQDTTFENCKIMGVSFIGLRSKLLSWKFKNCLIELCAFKALNMKYTHFDRCFVRETDFENVDLSESDFRGSDLQGSRFLNVKLLKADLTGAKNYGIDPTQNKVRQAKFSVPEVLNLLSPFGIEIE